MDLGPALPPGPPGRSSLAVAPAARVFELPELPGPRPLPTANAGPSAIHTGKASSPAIDLPLPGEFSSSNSRVRQLEQELEKVKEEQQIKFKTIEEYLGRQHEAKIASAEAKLATALQDVQAEQAKTKDAQDQLAKFGQDARVRIKDWSDYYDTACKELQQARETIQQLESGAQPALDSVAASVHAEKVAQLAQAGDEVDMLRQEVLKLQQAPAVKQEDTDAQQKLAQAQTRLGLLESDIAAAHERLKTSEAKLTDSESKLAEANSRADAEAAKFEEGFRVLQAETQKYAREYAADMDEKTKEIKSLKDRQSANHRNSNRSKKSSHSQDDTQETVKYRS